MFQNLPANDPPFTAVHQECAVWFRKRIHKQLQESIPPLRMALGPAGEGRWNLDVATAFKFFEALSKTIVSHPEDIRISSLVRDLRERNLVSRVEERESECCQAVFITLGWLTMLYTPKLQPRPATLEIYLPKMSLKSPRFHKQSTNLREDVNVDKADLSFGRLFATFGQRVPQTVQTSRQWQSDLVNRDEMPLFPSSISAPNIYYSNLLLVGKIRLEWVETMTEHLDLDERSRTLKIFRHPAYCTLICLSAPESTEFLNRFIGEPIDEQRSSTSIPSDATDLPFDGLCREILITFGMIFGQENRSRKAVAERYGDFPEQVQRDAVFRDLCTKPWEDHILFNYLDSPPIRSNYSTEKDFPFLGWKLMRIHKYMDTQSPNDFHTLIFDRRDQLRFWTFVSVMVFGVLSIAIGVVSIGLSIGQIIVSSH